MARNYMNASENIPRFGMCATVGGHNMHVENPEQNITQHPEWFALMGGKRNVHFPCCSRGRLRPDSSTTTGR